MTAKMDAKPWVVMFRGNRTGWAVRGFKYRWAAVLFRTWMNVFWVAGRRHSVERNA